MIDIIITKYGIHVRGHAEAGPKGQDIICAAISVLTQNLIYSLERLAEDKIKYVIEPGWVDINYWDLSDKGRLLIESFFVGVKEIAADHPDHVKLTRHERP